MDTAFPNAGTNFAFEFSLINISTTDAEDATILTADGWTLVGNMEVQAASALTLNTSGRFCARKTGTGAWTLYRLS
jgi:energy-converting hydrogenase Eha subunit B